ncbi:MAG TPA: VWA domain-containing protein [Pyrinomonadaceae bacterium]|nr:VWA domain-containing protein [Pyrinomonadaceae bacterium]
MLYRAPSAESSCRGLRLLTTALFLLTLAAPLPLVRVSARAQGPASVFERDLDAASPVELRVKNRTGRVTVLAEEESKRVSIRASSAAGVAVSERDVRVTGAAGAIQIEVEREGAASARPADGRKVVPSAAQVERERIDLTVRVPARSRVWVETEAGAVDVVGNVAEAEARTDTGTIRADVPLDQLRYSFRWTLSRPRFFSEVELPKVKEKRGGVYEISGRFPEEKKGKGKQKKDEPEPSEEEAADDTVLLGSAAVETGAGPEPKVETAKKEEPTADKPKSKEELQKEERRKREEAERKEEEAKKQAEALKKAREEKAKAAKTAAEKALKETQIKLSLETARGVLLFGVKDESRVPSDLRERTLTDAARAIIRSGDAELIDAIRKVAPRLVGEYAETLGDRRGGPTLGARGSSPFDVRTPAGTSLARVQARVTDRTGRAVTGLTAKDFTVTEGGVERAVREVRPVTAPFNLVLLLDVSGSVEERIDFIRKAALAFLNTAGPQDRIAIVSFRDDVQLVSEFTNDRGVLVERIKDIQAGGATSLYDALGYALVHVLRPLRGERTGVVVLSDGDDNRSFLSFPVIVDAVYETGAIIYPLYVPSGLIPSSSAPAAATTLDPTRTRFLTLTSRAEEEGARLAEVSGGKYYPITRLEQLQRAYDDVAAQLRTAYTITYETDAAARPDSRVRVKVSREGASVRLSPAVAVSAAATTTTPAQ